VTSEAEKRGTQAWKCQIIRIKEHSAVDRLLDEYCRTQRVYAGRRRVTRAHAVRELLQMLVDRKRGKTPGEPEQLGLFAPPPSGAVPSER
jgi:hypothetical protein